MKLRTFLLALLTVIFYFACQKHNDFIVKHDYQDAFIDSSVDYLKSQINNEDLSTIDLTTPHTYKEGNTIVAVSFFVKNEKEKSIIIGRDSNNKFLGNWVNIITKGAENFGILKTESFNGKETSEITYVNGKIVKSVKTNNGETQVKKYDYPIQNSIKSDGKVSGTVVTSNLEGFNGDGYGELPNVTVTGYVNNQTVNFYSLYWQTNQNVIYIYEYSYTPPGGGGGSSVGIAPTFIEPDHPISNITDEFKCFTQNANSTYTVTVNVNEPSPGTRNLAVGGVTHKVGHTYLTFEQDNTDGTKIIRNAGFYPRDDARPGSPNDVSIFGDDSNTPTAVTLKITVNAKDFNTVIQKSEGQSPIHYDLNLFNCSTSAINALSSIGVNLPATQGSSFFGALFQGDDPGDLGEDIRALNLSTFSQQNGNRKMVRNTSNSNSLMPPPRTGICN